MSDPIHPCTCGHTIDDPEPAFEPDDWPSRTEIYEETSP